MNDRTSQEEADMAVSGKAADRGTRRARIARGFRALFDRARADADYERFAAQHGPFKRYLP